LIGVGPAGREDPFGGQQVLQIECGGEEFDPFLGKFVGDRAEDGVGLLVFERGQQFDGGQIQPEPPEELRVFDLAGHHGFFHALFLQEGDGFFDLSEGDPVEPVARLFDPGVGLLLDPDDHHRPVLAPGLFGHQDRELAVPRDDSERFHGAVMAGRDHRRVQSASSRTAAVDLLRSGRQNPRVDCLKKSAKILTSGTEGRESICFRACSRVSAE